MNYIEPESFLKSFTCPHCDTLSRQGWQRRGWEADQVYPIQDQFPIRIGTCDNCKEHTLWIFEKLIYPDTGNAPFPNPLMPPDVKKFYIEAASIHTKSPRGAAALLRLAVQVLCKDLGESGKDINKDIGNLVSKGLPKIVQQSLDIVRVTGNDAVHPGQIDTDDPIIVSQLFKLLNVIVEYMIELPNKIEGIYESLPAEKKEGINVRDR